MVGADAVYKCLNHLYKFTMITSLYGTYAMKPDSNACTPGRVRVTTRDTTPASRSPWSRCLFFIRTTNKSATVSARPLAPALCRRCTFVVYRPIVFFLALTFLFFS